MDCAKEYNPFIVIVVVLLVEVVMRWLVALTVIVVLLLAGGGLTVQIASYSNDSEAVVPFLLKQTDDPEASAFEAVPWQTSAFFVYVLLFLVLFRIFGAHNYVFSNIHH